MPIDKCVKCGIPLQEFITGRKEIDGELYCNKHYYEIAGEIIEEHPIGSRFNAKILSETSSE